MKAIIRSAFGLITVVFVSLSAAAQAPAENEKAKLIDELIVVMKAEQQFPVLIDSILAEMERSLPGSFEGSIDANETLTPKEKAELKERLDKQILTFSQKVRKRLVTEIDYKKIVRETVVPLYDKFYSEKELRDLLAFYKTPTGQKFIETVPALMAESQKLTMEKFVPDATRIVEAVMQETFDELKAPGKPDGRDQ